MPRSTDILAVLAVLTCTLAAGAAQTCDCLVCDDGSEVQDQKKNIAKPGEPAFNCVGTLMANMDKFKCNVKSEFLPAPPPPNSCCCCCCCHRRRRRRRRRCCFCLLTLLKPFSQYDTCSHRRRRYTESMAEKTQKESIGHCKSMQESAQGDEDARDADLSASGGASDTAEQICSGVQEKDGTCQTCRAVQAEFYEKIGDKMNVDGCVELQNNLDFRKMSYPLADSAICEKHKKAFSFANVKDMQENFDRFELIYWPPKSTSSLADAKADTTFHYNCAMIGCCASFPVSCGTDEEGIASKNECEKGETPERYHRPFKGRLCRKKGVNERGSESDLICVPHTDGPCPETHEDCADFATDARTCDASCSTGTPVVFNSPKLDLIGKGKSLREVTGLPEEQKAVVCCQEHGKSVSIVREDECTTNEEMIQARNDQDGAGRDRRMELLARGTVVEFACCLEPRTEPNEPCTDETVNKDQETCEVSCELI